MEEKKSSKLSDIRATAFDAVAIMRQIGNPGVLESLTNVKETISKINDILKELQTPEMVKNIENFRIISENINDASTKMKFTVKELKETGVIDKTSGLIDSAKKRIDSFGMGEDSINGNDVRNVVLCAQEMFVSIKDLVGEMRETIILSKKSDTITNAQQVIKGVSEIYKTATSAN